MGNSFPNPLIFLSSLNNKAVIFSEKGSKNMRNRNIKKQFWISTIEDELLKKKSKIAGLSEAELLRSFIKGYTIKAQPTKEIKQFQRELYGIANNINQIAKISNSRFSTSHDDYEFILKQLTDFILRFEKTIYSRKK